MGEHCGGALEQRPAGEAAGLCGMCRFQRRPGDGGVGDDDPLDGFLGHFGGYVFEVGLGEIGRDLVLTVPWAQVLAVLALAIGAGALASVVPAFKSPRRVPDVAL